MNPTDLSMPEELNIPVIVGVGDQDELFEIESAKALYDEIPSKNKSFFVMKGAKHAEFPDGSLNELTKWLESNFTVR